MRFGSHCHQAAVAGILEGNMREAIKIDIWSDIACPWCYIGKRNFDNALTQLSQQDEPPRVEVAFHSFQLSPDSPIDLAQTDIDARMKARGLTQADAEAMMERVTEAAATAGLAYRMDLSHPTNTARAHALTHFAAQHGQQLPLMERLMSAHLCEGIHIGHIDNLVRLAEEAGLDPAEARAALEHGTYDDAVTQDRAQAAQYGITSVPTFVFNERAAISGAQPTEVFTQIIRQLWDKQNTAS